MKKYVLFTLLTILSFSAGAQNDHKDWANFGRYEEANRSAPKNIKAVFIGNSITDGWAAADPGFFTENGYLGRGIGGQVTSQMLVRFRADVIDLHPQAVVILAGVNDIALNNGYISLENTFGNIVSMAELARLHKIKVILCSVLPAADFKWRPGLEPAPKILKLNSMLKAYAEQNGIEYVDYHSAMKDEHDGLPEKYTRDGVHPTIDGYKVMEAIIKPVIKKVTK